MLKIRLRKQGAKHRPSYRIVVAHDRSPRGGRVVESLGLYEPKSSPTVVTLNVDRARYWLSVGAQPSSPTVEAILRNHGILTEDNKLVPVAGTLTDPLTRTLAELIRRVDPVVARSTPRTIELAGRLAEYVRELGNDYPDPPGNRESLDTAMRVWIREFVAKEFPGSAIKAATDLAPLDMAAD